MEFRSRTDIIVMGKNPEMADMSNPNGYLYGYASYVEAIKEDGSKKELFIIADWDEEVALTPANKLAEKLQARWNNLKRLPVRFGAWRVGHAVYGSEAYLKEDHRDPDDYSDHY